MKGEADEKGEDLYTVKVTAPRHNKKGGSIPFAHRFYVKKKKL